MPRIVPAAVASATLLSATLSFAAEPTPSTAAPQTQVYYYQQATPTPYYQQYQNTQPQPEQRQTFFGRMMDLERRKNQAILRFFGLR